MALSVKKTNFCVLQTCSAMERSKLSWAWKEQRNKSSNNVGLTSKSCGYCQQVKLVRIYSTRGVNISLFSVAGTTFNVFSSFITFNYFIGDIIFNVLQTLVSICSSLLVSIFFALKIMLEDLLVFFQVNQCRHCECIMYNKLQSSGDFRDNILCSSCSWDLSQCSAWIYWLHFWRILHLCLLNLSGVFAWGRGIFINHFSRQSAVASPASVAASPTASST